MKPQLSDGPSETQRAEGSYTTFFDPRQLELHDDIEELRRLSHERFLEGRAVWDLSMVNPDLPPPRPVLDRLLESVTKGSNHRYAVSRGVRRLREGFSLKYRNRFNKDLDPETEVCVCLGSKDATFHALRALLAPGDTVIVSTPAYPAHPSAVALAGGRCVFWDLKEDPDVAAQNLSAFIAEHRPKVLLLNLPSNPTGAIVSRRWWHEVGRVCAANSVTILNDFVYGEMCFSGEAAESSLAAIDVGARCVEVYSLSKAYNVPGWRVGALVGDSAIVSAVARLKSQSDYGLFLPLQYAATQALVASEDLVASTVKTYQRRIRVLAAGLRELGWRVVDPAAGACLWVGYPDDLPKICANRGKFNSVDVARHLLVSAGVVVTPGVIFGPDCDGWLRFAAVVNEERLRDVVSAIRRICF